MPAVVVLALGDRVLEATLRGAGWGRGVWVIPVNARAATVAVNRRSELADNETVASPRALRATSPGTGGGKKERERERET